MMSKSHHHAVLTASAMLLACGDEAASSAPLVRSDPWPIVESQLDEVSPR